MKQKSHGKYDKFLSEKQKLGGGCFSASIYGV